MSVWRKRAYAIFGFKPGTYSYVRGKVELFADLAAMAEEAVAKGNDVLLGRILDYVGWAADQSSEDLASAVDLGFFLRAFRSPALCASMQKRISEKLFQQKWQNLMVEPD